MLEVADVASHNSECELQGGRGDKQVLEGDRHALRGLLALDPPSEPGDFESGGVHRHVVDHFIQKSLAALPAFFRSVALNAVDQFHNGHYG